MASAILIARNDPFFGDTCVSGKFPRGTTITFRVVARQ